jgi:hypothetical protein
MSEKRESESVAHGTSRGVSSSCGVAISVTEKTVRLPKHHDTGTPAGTLRLSVDEQLYEMMDEMRRRLPATFTDGAGI